MNLKELANTAEIHYLWTDGGFHRKFSHKDIEYEASLLPQAEYGSTCIIIKIDRSLDTRSVTAPVDDREVYHKRYATFKEEDLINSIKDYLVNYAM